MLLLRTETEGFSVLCMCMIRMIRMISYVYYVYYVEEKPLGFIRPLEKAYINLRDWEEKAFFQSHATFT